MVPFAEPADVALNGVEVEGVEADVPRGDVEAGLVECLAECIFRERRVAEGGIELKAEGAVADGGDAIFERLEESEYEEDEDGGCGAKGKEAGAEEQAEDGDDPQGGGGGEAADELSAADDGARADEADAGEDAEGRRIMSSWTKEVDVLPTVVMRRLASIIARVAARQTSMVVRMPAVLPWRSRSRPMKKLAIAARARRSAMCCQVTSRVMRTS